MSQFGIRYCLFILTLAISILVVFFTLSFHFGSESNPVTTYTPPPKINDGRFYWTDVPVKYPLSTLVPLPSGQPMRLTAVQHSFDRETGSQASERRQRQNSVRDVFSRCWNSYQARAWMKDELLPITGGSQNAFGGWAVTLVDSLDTLHIMGMEDEFTTAVAAVRNINFSMSTQSTVNIFETNVRYLGGLLSAYDLSRHRELLDKAVEVGEMIYVAFDTPNRMPITHWDWRLAAAGVAGDAVTGPPQEASTGMPVSELGSFTLEFTRLSQLTNDTKWYDAAQRISVLFASQQYQTKLPGMWPVSVNAQEMNLTGDNLFSLGARADSLYEYFPKEYALLGGLEPLYRDLYVGSMDAAIQHIFFSPMLPDDSKRNDIILSGNALASSPDNKISLEPEAQHLDCFAGGMLALGGKLFNLPDHVSIAQKLVNGCIWAYDAFPLGIMPEIFDVVPCPSSSPNALITPPCAWNTSEWHASIISDNRLANASDTRSVSEIITNSHLPPGVTSISDPRYLLRPEAIESIFVLYRITGDRELLSTAWDMFLSLDKYTQTEFANAALDDVTVPATNTTNSNNNTSSSTDDDNDNDNDNDAGVAKTDRMESYWMAETLKYFYLIFSDTNTISLDEWVFNTEAHPFRRPGG